MKLLCRAPIPSLTVILLFVMSIGTIGCDGAIKLGPGIELGPISYSNKLVGSSWGYTRYISTAPPGETFYSIVIAFNENGAYSFSGKPGQPKSALFRVLGTWSSLQNTVKVLANDAGVIDVIPWSAYTSTFKISEDGLTLTLGGSSHPSMLPAGKYSRLSRLSGSLEYVAH